MSGRQRLRRRKTELDLNVPPAESRDQDGISTQAYNHEVSFSVQQQQPPVPPPPTMIDLDAPDDDVVESSPRAFAEAKRKSRRLRERDVVILSDSGRASRLANNGRGRPSPPNHLVLDCDQYNGNSKRVNDPKPPPPPKEPTFACPICMGPLSEEMSTRCGHIFCKNCIRAALAVQAKCPTCRKRVTVKELIRVFLPSTTN